jgi:endonuclease/exonuclease/phosphatase family metal-dependent hydrolase
LLQEVDRNTERSGAVDQVAVLAQLTGYHGAFGRTLYYQGGEYGIAVLSRWPVTADTLYSLPVAPPQPRAAGSYEPRGALHAVIEAPNGGIQLLNTHLDASPADHYRLQEVDTLTRLVNQLAAQGSVLLGGDLNATPESVVLHRITEGRWRDAWKFCGQGTGFTYPAQAPVKRIDYLVLPSSLKCDSARVISTDASDHRPVLFVLSNR